MSVIQFDPFNDRLSRDIRNGLSTSLTTCLKEMSIIPAMEIAKSFDPASLPACYQDYINNRLNMYRIAIDKTAVTEDDPLCQAVILWDLQLFFEVHEVLEHAWLKADGDKKLILQALIRAAGAYIKQEFGALSPATRLAEKAVTVLNQHKMFLAPYFDPDTLIQALQDVTRAAPKLGKE
ncbi:DUF309 domain-containing protein [Desulfopila sp. IMCC35008]|uniref:DUF309 domain-containing protein n=1 Tax=Desulfopila sp. IMCC35008 TaxID=2653858 RepID=UPI0013D501CF|nr:DUF309 domain-containing protein [Desulfopila sp. IMCC35008]